MNYSRETFTILGASGFIGRNLCAAIERAGHRVRGVTRGESLPSDNLGQVIFAIGVTGDFRTRPIDTVEAHVCTLAHLLREAEFQSLLYLSSTRVYAGSSIADEGQPIQVNPGDADHLYNLSKLTGESLTLHSGRQNVRVARLSNVVDPEFDSPNFLDSLVRDAVENHEVVLNSHPQSTRDYVLLDDVLNLLPAIALRGRESIYNIASGEPIASRDVLEVLHRQTDCTVRMTSKGAAVHSPRISIQRAHVEFGFAPSPILPAIETMLAEYQRRTCPT